MIVLRFGHVGTKNLLGIPLLLSYLGEKNMLNFHKLKEQINNDQIISRGLNYSSNHNLKKN
jgi:hypothetical protein